MTIVNYTAGNMSPAQETALAGFDYIFAVQLPRQGDPTELNVSVLAKQALQVVPVDLSVVGTPVPQPTDGRLIKLTLPDRTIRYCTGGAGKWIWVGLEATHKDV